MLVKMSNAFIQYTNYYSSVNNGDDIGKNGIFTLIILTKIFHFKILSHQFVYDNYLFTINNEEGVDNIPFFKNSI